MKMISISENLPEVSAIALGCMQLPVLGSTGAIRNGGREENPCSI